MFLIIKGFFLSQYNRMYNLFFWLKIKKKNSINILKSVQSAKQGYDQLGIFNKLSLQFTLIFSFWCGFESVKRRTVRGSVAGRRLQMHTRLSESALRLAFSWTPRRISSNKYGNLSMRAKLLSRCFLPIA